MTSLGKLSALCVASLAGLKSYCDIKKTPHIQNELISAWLSTSVEVSLMDHKYLSVTPSLCQSSSGVLSAHTHRDRMAQSNALTNKNAVFTLYYIDNLYTLLTLRPPKSSPTQFCPFFNVYQF